MQPRKHPANVGVVVKRLVILERMIYLVKEDDKESNTAASSI